ncbi:hypothetical protein QBC44DRAFT_294605 [Cladorrhinum sp. PSN332]|nr:hypothetical protein QBC44DRAFT_294605 [Cladorrhinum sp. PSN332]
MNEIPNSNAISQNRSLAESIHCFRIPHNSHQPGTTGTATTRPKAKYTDQVKEKVLGVRRQGACLRCRMLKIECSLQNPCEACLSSAVKKSERKVLSFSYCVRTRFSDVNIFYSSDANKMRTDTLMLKMSNLLQRIAVPASFSFFLGSEKAFNKTVTAWLTNPGSEIGGGSGSIVGLCCSNLLALQFREEEHDAAGLEELTNDFQRFLLAASVSHTGSYPRCQGDGGIMMRPGEICTAGHLSGSRLLLRLDRTLTPQYLSKLSRSSCQVLFLFVLGAVLGMGYSSSPDLRGGHSSPEFPSEMLMHHGGAGADFQQSPTLWLTMREHLCQMLAHHLIYLGGMLGIKLETGMERRIIESAGRGWGKSLPEGVKGGYVWGDGIIQQPEMEIQVDKRKGKTTTTTTSPMMAEQPPPPAWGSPKSEVDYTPPSSPLGPPRSPLVPIACGPELAHFQSQNQGMAQDWDQNPASYLDMEFEEPDNYYSPPPYSEGEKGTYMEGKIMASYPRSNTEPYRNYTHEQRRQEYGAPKEVKRRTMWIVRTVDAGPPYGEINVHARLRGGRDLEGLRSFV